MNTKAVSRTLCLFLAAVCLSGCMPQTQPPEETFSQIFHPSQSETETTRSTLPPETTAPAQTETVIPETEPPAVTAADFAQLSALTAAGVLQPGDTVRLTAGFEITQPLVFSVPVSFSVEAEILCTCPITVETGAAGQIAVTVGEGVAAEGLDFRFDAPNCDLIWTKGAPYTSEEQAAELLNVRTFNGTDLRSLFGLGGVGETKLTALTLNAGSDAALSWSLTGNTAYLAVNYLTGDKVLKNAQVQLTLSDGSTLTETLDLTQPQLRYTLTDAAGNSRVYRIVTDRISCNLPVFYIEIENGAEVTSKETYLNATVRIDTENAYGDFPSLETKEVLIRGRGHYSWRFPKTPYKLRFEKKTSVMGLNASKNWVLLANYVDRSLIQNYVAMEMGKVMDNIPYHSNQYPVDVFVNGTYRGVYTFGEQLEAKKERINLTESYTEPDTDYLLELGGSDDGDVYGRDYFTFGTLRCAAVKHPDSTKLTQEQIDFLSDYMYAADKAVRELSNYEDYIDVDSVIDWVILHELTYNLDCCFRRSCYLIKEKGGKLKMGPIWDFDLAFGSYFRYTGDNWATVGSSEGYVGITWMNYLMEDPAFMEKFTARWNEIKEPLLEKALSSVDTMSALVSPSAQLNFQVWDTLGKEIPSQPSWHAQYDTYEKMTQRLRNFLTNRWQWMDKQLNS